MSYEEYRAEALTKLGADFELEDLRNEERWRLKVLEALDNYSGGGGSSEFSTAVMTITTSDGGGSNFFALPHITENGISNENILLSSSQPVDVIIPLYNGKLIIYDDFNPSFTSIDGDITISGSNYVITGNCTVNYEPA